MKIAILTNFAEFLPGYSLTQIVKEQAYMLSKYGHEVHLFVLDRYKGETFSDSVVLEKKIPFSHLIDYRSINDLTEDHKGLRDKTAGILVEELSKDYEAVFTHDFIFTGWNLPYGLACEEAGKKLENVRWLHWIHSVPTAFSDWWEIRRWGNKHKIVYPNSTDRIQVAEQYRGNPNNVRVIPHIKDLRSFADFDQETIDFLDAYPEIMQSDIVQIYPASVDRLHAKRVDYVISILSNIKKMGFSVCLCVANQWATGKKQKEDVEKYKKLAIREGLKPQTEVIFTSDYKNGKYGVGIPKRMVRELFMCSNLFIFPTREESFGLAMPEAALSSGCLLVLNKSLGQQVEISGHNALYFNFGSFNNKFDILNPALYFSDLAKIIIGRIQQNESILCKTFIRQRYNYDNIYNKYYAPILAESKLWL
jgi:hypothetical protein